VISQRQGDICNRDNRRLESCPLSLTNDTCFVVTVSLSEPNRYAVDSLWSSNRVAKPHPIAGLPSQEKRTTTPHIGKLGQRVKQQRHFHKKGAFIITPSASGSCAVEATPTSICSDHSSTRMLHLWIPEPIVGHRSSLVVELSTSRR
jgi:hypothetical protein